MNVLEKAVLKLETPSQKLSVMIKLCEDSKEFWRIAAHEALKQVSRVASLDAKQLSDVHRDTCADINACVGGHNECTAVVAGAMPKVQSSLRSKAFNRAQRASEAVFVLQECMLVLKQLLFKAGVDAGELEGDFKLWQSSLQTVKSAWPMVLKNKHSLAIIQALFVRMEQGEDAEKRKEQLRICWEVIQADALMVGRPKAAAVPDVLMVALQKASPNSSDA